MKCPYCGGDFETLDLLTASGQPITANHCTQCSGFWFDRPPAESFNAESVGQYDTPQPNFSVKSADFACPNDQTILVENDPGPGNSRSWRCDDCGGVFYPRGQLALFTANQSPTAKGGGLNPRTQGGLAISLLLGLVVLSLASLSRGNFSFTYLASTNQPLPTAGPNIITLILLAVTYLAGTVLAVLGRRLPIIVLGWCVIAVCLIGFSVLIFAT